MSRPARRLFRLAPVVGLALALCAAGCDRNIEPYDPDEPVAQPDLSKIFPEAAERTAEGAPGGVMGGPMAAPGGPQAGSGPRGAAPAAASAGAPLSGTVRLSPGLEGRVPPNATLFLIARTADAGPPTAVVRVPVPRFPFSFTIGPDDRMIAAMPFEGPFRLTARVDADGNAMSRNPGDLQGAADGEYAPGASGVDILVDEVL